MLKGKTAVITGASRGIGRGIAVCFAKQGADLILNATREEHLNECMEEVRSYGVKALVVGGDMADPQTSERMVQCAVEKYGKLDIVVNNAGINRDGLLHKLTDRQWQEVLDVNLNGTFYLMRSAAQKMREQKSGRIINISSASWQGNFGQANYAASKAAVVALTQTAARELGVFHITCNAICPGLIETDMTAPIPPAIRQNMLEKIWLGHSGQPEDIGNAAVFLASDLASYITGEILSVGGGLIL
ncbi:3-oxoacyl-ACP reductase FabG [Eubacterium ramulus]